MISRTVDQKSNIVDQKRRQLIRRAGHMISRTIRQRSITVDH
jgi:hypothetical protein